MEAGSRQRMDVPLHRANLGPAMPSRCPRRVASLALLWTLLPTAAAATEARSEALAGSPFLFDDTDVFRFPSALPRHAGLVVVSDGLATGLGPHGGVILGDQLAFGLFVGRRSGGRALDLRNEVLDGPQLPIPEKIVDLLVAYRVDAAHTAGLSIGVSHGLDRSTNRDAGDNGTVTASVELMVGHSWDSPQGHLDSAFGLEFPYYRSTERFEVLAEVPVDPSFTLSHRSFWSLGGRVQAAVSAGLRRDDLDITLPAAGRSATGSVWWMELEAGPRILVSSQVTLAVSAVLSREARTVDDLDSPPRRSSQGETVITRVPGFRVALEGRPTTWLDVRFGLLGGRLQRTTEDGAGNSAATSESSAAWTTGVGLRLGDLRLDGILTREVLREGPNFVGGTTPGLFTSFAASYIF